MQGLVLTHTTDLAALLDAMRAASIPCLKVVTSWGWPWDADSRRQAATLAALIVRTTSGDGTQAPPGESVYLDPTAVLNELAPWVEARPALTVELGNEPNASDPSDDAAWAWRYYFIETMDAIRRRWPAVRILSPGLIENNQDGWWSICRDAFMLADGIGFHAYAWHDFTDTDTGQIQRALFQLRALFENNLWALTECGINDVDTAPEVKAQRYGAMHRELPSNVAAACWYHYADDPLGDDQDAYALPASAFASLGAGGAIV